MEERRFGLVACSKAKLDHPAPARELYRSPLFRKSVAWIEPRVEAWAVLSALHGVVLPDVELDPYDRTLADYTAQERAAWGWNVWRQLLATFPQGAPLVILAGEPYVAPLRRAMFHLDLVTPLAGLQLGERLHYLTTDGRTKNA